MILVDAGPLVALIDRDDRDHERCVQALSRIRLPMITTWPAFTEAMYFLGHRIGWHVQDGLWQMVLRKDLLIDNLSEAGMTRARDLMGQYRNIPMDLADATLVALAESSNRNRIFTLDSDFRIYRIHGKRAFVLLP